MSGGKFDYVQNRLDDPANEIEARILFNHKTRAEAHKMICEAEDQEDLTLYYTLYSVREYIDFWRKEPLSGRLPEVWDSDEHGFRIATNQEILEHNAEHVFDFDDEEVEIFRRGAKAVKTAQVYLQRIDWFLSGDDGDESFKKRLAEELAEIEK